MTLSEVNPSSVGEAEHDKHSRSLPGGRSGPNKDGASAPDGASALGNEIGAEGDAQRDRAQAIREGDILPDQEGSRNNSGTAGDLGFGQQTGYEKGMSDNPSYSQRENMQSNKNESWQSDQRKCIEVACLVASTSDLLLLEI